MINKVIISIVLDCYIPMAVWRGIHCFNLICSGIWKRAKWIFSVSPNHPHLNTPLPCCWCPSVTIIRWWWWWFTFLHLFHSASIIPWTIYIIRTLILQTPDLKRLQTAYICFSFSHPLYHVISFYSMPYCVLFGIIGGVQSCNYLLIISYLFCLIIVILAVKHK